MPSRSRHSRNRNTHSNRSSNKTRNRIDVQSQSQSQSQSTTYSKSSDSKSPNITTNAHKHRSHTPPYEVIDVENEESMASIHDFEEEIIYELRDDSLSICELSLLLEQYLHRRNASSLFLFRIINEWSSGERTTDRNMMNNNLLHHSECCDKIRNTLFKVLFGLTDKISFKNVINQIAFVLSLIKILSSGLPTLCVALMHWISKHVQSSHLSSSHLEKDQLRFIIMFLRPEIIEQCAELVQYNASIFEDVFRELINALCDKYQPFRIWLFARLCSKQRKLIEAQLAKFICFGDKKDDKKPIIKDTNKQHKRSKSWIVNIDDEDDDKEDEEMNLNRLIQGFKYCMNASNQLVINNESTTYYELGHLILNEIICIASRLRYHFSDEYRALMDGYLAIMHCNLGSIYLQCNRYNSALISAQRALEYDSSCIQCHRIIAEYYLSYLVDINSTFSCLYCILSVDSDHPYAMNRAKEIVNDVDIDVDSDAYICRSIGSSTAPCARCKHSAVSYRGDRLIIYGGISGDNNRILNDLWILDICSNRWMQLDTVGVIPWPRHSHSADIIQHKMYIIGGAKREDTDDDNTNKLSRVRSEINHEFMHLNCAKKRIFSLKSHSNRFSLETVVTYDDDEDDDDDDETKDESTKTPRGYALGGWFTNFFNKNDHNKIKELATKGIIDSDIDLNTESEEVEDDDDDDDEDDESESYYDETRFPAIEMLDLKHNKWIKPETTGNGPKYAMINHRSICVGKKIFLFDFNGEKKEEKRALFVLHTDTLHWESFSIPGLIYRDMVIGNTMIPTVYDNDKILLITPFGVDGYYKHCLLFTKSMEWSPIRMRPITQLTGYNRLNGGGFAATTFKHYMVIHGGITPREKRKTIQKRNHETQSCILSLHCDDDGDDDMESFDTDSHSENEDEDMLLSPLYTIDSIDNTDSRVSVVEALLFNKSVTDVHRIGPLHTLKEKQEVNTIETRIKRVKRMKTRTGSRKTTTQIITSSCGETRRRKTITTMHGDKEEDSEVEDEKEEDVDRDCESHIQLSNLEIFDFVSMRWLPRIALHEVSSVEGGVNSDVVHKFNNHNSGSVDDSNASSFNILNTPRMNHSISIVGSHLCIFGGMQSNSNVLMISNFASLTDRINEKYYKNNSNSGSNGSGSGYSNYDCTNAMSLSKYLFGANCTNQSQNRMVECANCAILECNRFNFRTCSGCAKVQYCSKLCQKNHWKLKHRHHCHKNHIRYQ